MFFGEKRDKRLSAPMKDFHLFLWTTGAKHVQKNDEIYLQFTFA